MSSGHDKLDDLKYLEQLDTIDAIGDTMQYAEQFREGLEIANRTNVKRIDTPVHEIVMCGTGGGSMACINILKSLLYDRIEQPIILNQSYQLPAYVDQHSVVCILSHSGNTEEMISCYEQAIAAGANIIVLTSGGTILDMAKKHDHDVITVPGGMMPRIVPGYILIPILTAFQQFGFIDDLRSEIDETITWLEQARDAYGPTKPYAENKAKQIAMEMNGFIPVVYGVLPYTDSIAWRFKNQLGENSKLMAFWNAIPAVHHDEAVGWDAEPDMFKTFHFTLIQDREDDARNQNRLTATQEILEERAGGVTLLTTEGESRFTRLISILYLTDWISIYLPLLRGVDPTPVEVLNIFKAKVGQPQLFVKRRNT